MDLVKRILLFLVVIVGLTTILLELFVFGSYEDMVDEEYDDLQIQFDFDKLGSGITGLFGGGSGGSSSSKKGGGGSGPSGGNSGGSYQAMPTAPAMQPLY